MLTCEDCLCGECGGAAAGVVGWSGYQDPREMWQEPGYRLNTSKLGRSCCRYEIGVGGWVGRPERLDNTCH